MIVVKKKREKQVGVKLWRAFNSRLINLTVNLWTKGSHDVAHKHKHFYKHLCFINMNLAVYKKNQKGRETVSDEIKGNCQ